MAHSPTVTLDLSEMIDDIAQDYLSQIRSGKVDVQRALARVRVAGPIDKLTCARCLPFVGKEFDRDDPEVQPFRSGGLHPRCRHYAVPVGVPGLDREPPRTGREILDEAFETKDEGLLKRLFGPKRASEIIDGDLEEDDLYRDDGTLKPLDDLHRWRD
jgi:hypothetical protein